MTYNGRGMPVVRRVYATQGTYAHTAYASERSVCYVGIRTLASVCYEGICTYAGIAPASSDEVPAFQAYVGVASLRLKYRHAMRA